MAAFPSYNDYLAADDSEAVRRNKRRSPFPDIPATPDPISRDSPEDIALGEDFGKGGHGLYRVHREGNSVSMAPFDPNEPLPDEPGPTRRKRSPAVPMPASPQTPVPVENPYAGPSPSRSTALRSLFPIPAETANPDPTIGPATPHFPTPTSPIDPKVGIPTEGLNKTGKRLAEIEAMRKADPTSKIHSTDWGYEYDPPNPHPSRLRQTLQGLLQGALAGASQTGTLGGAIGGAGVGAAAGGINPRLMLALRRDQDIRRAQGQLSEDLKLQREQAQITGIGAQPEADWARAQAEIAKANMAYAGEYTDPDTGEVVRMSPEEAAKLRQGDRAEAGRARRGGRSATPHYETRPDGTYVIDAQSPEGRKLANVPGKPDNDPQAAAAEEGDIAATEAARSAEEIKQEMDELRGPAMKGRKSISQKDAVWRTEAARRYKEALSNYVQGVDAKPELKDYIAQVQAEDSDFQNGTYDTTVKNTEAKEKRLQELEKELHDVQKEGRAGRAKAGRSAGARSASRGPSATTHAFSISAYKKANPNATDDDARAFAAKNYPGFDVIP